MNDEQRAAILLVHRRRVVPLICIAVASIVCSAVPPLAGFAAVLWLVGLLALAGAAVIALRAGRNRS